VSCVGWVDIIPRSPGVVLEMFDNHWLRWMCVLLCMQGIRCLCRCSHRIQHQLHVHSLQYVIPCYSVYCYRWDNNTLTCSQFLMASQLSLPHGTKNRKKLEMWANVQRDGRPANYRWRPLFNIAKFGWRSLLECCAVTLPRCETRWN